MVLFRKQAAELLGISTETLRYYECIGLIAPDHNGKNGYRVYGEETINRVNIIKSAKACGLSLSETKEAIDLLYREDLDYEEIKEKATKKIDDINLKITELNKYKAILTAVKCNIENKVECPLKNAINKFK